jgi:hypothetical protein
LRRKEEKGDNRVKDFKREKEWGHLHSERNTHKDIHTHTHTHTHKHTHTHAHAHTHTHIRTHTHTHTHGGPEACRAPPAGKRSSPGCPPVVLESNGYVLESNSYGVSEQRLWC